MEASQLSKYFSDMGRKGGKARMDKMTPEQRKRVAKKASDAAAEARKLKARGRKKAK